MKIVVPMAGRGKRMRPHTLTTPKPLIPIAGVPIVKRLVSDIARIVQSDIEEIAYVIGDFGREVEEDLCRVAESLGAKGTIYHQDEPLGTAHAVYCAKESLDGEVIVAFSDTLFIADFVLDTEADGIIWVHQVDDPSQFGVVKLDGAGIITDFIEKPQEPVSDLAIIGIYYFRDGKRLHDELQYLIDHDVRVKGEYQLTDALENLKTGGVKFKTGQVTEWLDCGNKDATVYTNDRILANLPAEGLVSSSAKLEDSVIVPPCYIGEGVVLNRSVVGPYVSVGDNTVIESSVIKHSIIQASSYLCGQYLAGSMVGNSVRLFANSQALSLGDYNSSES